MTEARDWSGYFLPKWSPPQGAAVRTVPVGREQAPTSPAMVVLRPGDKVLVTIPDDPDPDEAWKTTQTVLTALREHFPGVDFLIVSGITGIAVSPPT